MGIPIFKCSFKQLRLLGQVWCLIVLIPDLCPLSYFHSSLLRDTFDFKGNGTCNFPLGHIRKTIVVQTSNRTNLGKN